MNTGVGGMVIAESRLIEGRSVEEVDDYLSRVTGSIGIEAGTVCRIARQYLHNWLGGAANMDDEKLDRICEESQTAEWKNGGKGLDIAIHEAIRGAGLEKGNDELNEMVADMAVSILLSMHDGKRVFTVCDIGAGTGETTKAFLNRLAHVMGESEGRAFASRFLRLILLEPSMHRLTFAYDSIKSAEWQPESFQIEPSSIGSYFPGLPEGKFDMAISSAVLHHMPCANYLKEIYRKLASDGVLVAGDWFHTVFSHPAMIMPLLSARGYPEMSMAGYMRFFGIREGDLERMNKQFTESEREDNAAVLRFLAALADGMRKFPGVDFRFLEATESFREREGKMAGAGFESDMEELRQKHRGFIRLARNIRQAYPGHDLANVIAVAKVPKQTLKG